VFRIKNRKIMSIVVETTEINTEGATNEIRFTRWTVLTTNLLIFYSKSGWEIVKVPKFGQGVGF